MGEGSVELDLARDHDVLLVTFGGITGGFHMPPFEFARLTETLPAKRMLVRDPAQAWYHRGIAEAPGSLQAVADHVGRTASDAGVGRLVLIGTSMGGYAALAVGHLVGADEVLAFSPQTFIDRRLRRRAGDERWASEIEATYAGGPVPWALRDLRRLLRRRVSARGTYRVHVAKDYPLDRSHADRVRRSRGVVVTEHAGESHDLVRALRDSGELDTLLHRAVRGG